jgi:hypothetical protein
MTRKYFQMLAETVADLIGTMDLTLDQEDTLSHEILVLGKRMNPRFNPERFQKAVHKHLTENHNV